MDSSERLSKYSFSKPLEPGTDSEAAVLVTPGVLERQSIETFRPDDRSSQGNKRPLYTAESSSHRSSRRLRDGAAQARRAVEAIMKREAQPPDEPLVSARFRATGHPDYESGAELANKTVPRI